MYIDFTVTEIEQALRNQQELIDLQSRAEHLSETLGRPVESWHTFRITHPPDNKKHVTGGLGLGIIGAIAGVAAAITLESWGVQVTGLGMALPALGAAIGGYIGYNRDTPNDKRERQVKSYARYLDQLESLGVGLGRGVLSEQISHSHAHVHGDHVASLLASRMNDLHEITR